MNKKVLFLIKTYLILISSQLYSQTFTVESVLSYPFPTELTSSPSWSKIAWTFNEQGRRNIYVAEAPDFTPRKITDYTKDDGQELTSISISADGKWVVFVRGGDHSGSNSSMPVNAAFDPIAAKVQIISVPFEGGKSNILVEADEPIISPASDRIIFAKGGQVMSMAIDGSSAAKPLFYARGTTGSLSYSPDGTKIAFVSSRGDHSFIGVFTDEQNPINWILPAFSRDSSPRWSPDGKSLAFVRMPGTGGKTDSIFARRHQPWTIWTADIESGNGQAVWKAPETLEGSVPPTHGGTNLHWAAGNRIVFVSYQDGWPHLYSVDANGGKELLLTPGSFMVEQIRLSNDKKWLVFAANAGKDPSDIDRRHIVKVPVDRAQMKILTPGDGIEAYPVITGDNNTIAFLSSTAQRPLLPAIMKFDGGPVKLLGENLIPAGFPESQLVTPKHVTFKAPDGQTVYGQLFEPKNAGKGKRPAVVYVHGGPQRQMVLGWHFMDYYSIDYGLNQYLANLGFTVLSVNYRLGIGYGYKFQRALNAGAMGASEYQDVKAAGEWLANQPNIDANKIGIYGGSYGGYLVALALGRDSKLFAAGVDIHGVNNRFSNYNQTSREEAPDAELYKATVEKSSPVSYIDTWTSPTLIIHADDDRNVNFSQSVDLARRFEDKKFEFEYLAIPDDTHHWMKYSNGVKVSEVTAEFLQRKLMAK
ncbi:MAG: prolyl oligopeptidase family serine peptidase [Daejeonella sp.]|uniref:S9 family peptidase n=1 Tax=Daejeonella sp. TaxID=2805397 RepID=UPI003C73C948